MKRIELVMALGILAILVLGYGLTTTYAHQDTATNNTGDGYEEHDYDECPMHEVHHEEMEQYHNQMMSQWEEQSGPRSGMGMGMGMGGC